MTKLIDTITDRAALSADDVAWLDAYHAEVEAKLASRVAGATLAWLRAACAPI